MHILFLIAKFIILGIAYLLAPIAAFIRALYINTMQFSNKILQDVYPPVFEVRQPGTMQVPLTNCCQGKVMAKQNNGHLEYFYCEKCKKEITEQELKDKKILQ